MIALVGMETSGQIRRRLAVKGFDVISCDLLPSDDDVLNIHNPTVDKLRQLPRPLNAHIVGDVFALLDDLWATGLWPTVAVFHPDCTVLTGSAEWAFADPDFERYPGVGYHQRVKEGTLTGQARRDAREKSIGEFRKLIAEPIRVKIFENPVGVLTRHIGKPFIIQPYECGDDASKKTCLWAFDKSGNQIKDFPFIKDPSKYIPPTLRPNGKRYWANQTDSGQNKLSPGDDRWKERSKTYDGIADFVVDSIGRYFGI